jgi:anaerobic selenocysteine-containing dehydrogenase
MYSMNNHRVISMQHKCIEPLGESKSDYDIFLAIAERLDLGALFRGRQLRVRVVQARI